MFGPKTGDVLAAVGGVDFETESLQSCLLGQAEAGLAIKPIIYAAALDKGILPSSLWNDTPVGYNRGSNEIWKPLNYERKLYGTLSLRGGPGLFQQYHHG